jgi:hypothetical protein
MILAGKAARFWWGTAAQFWQEKQYDFVRKRSMILVGKI